MKKIFLLLISTAVVGVWAAKQEPAVKRKCSLSPLQTVITMARNEKEIQYLAKKKIDFNQKQKCGGTILQLAIRRGNPAILKVLLENNISISEPVSLADFPIQGAPEKVPLIDFAAYYAPNAEILKLLIEAGANIVEKDANGETALWYIAQNPVLSNTQMQDILTQALLFTKPVEPEEEKTQSDEPKKYVPRKPVMIESEPDMPMPVEK